LSCTSEQRFPYWGHSKHFNSFDSLHMKISFAKYHGLGNDFALADDSAGEIMPHLTAERIRKLCDRHQGIGADGLILRREAPHAQHAMVLFNADGSRAELSGNGLRCFVLFLRQRGYETGGEITVETGGGVLRAHILQDDLVETTMPPPRFSTEGKPKPLELEANGEHFVVVLVNVGNPHGVIFGPERDIAFAKTYGPLLEKNPAFAEGANIEFVNVLSPKNCKLVVWERGAGITMACGSGSVATACAGTALGHFAFDTPISVQQPGGTLLIRVASGFREIRQSGPATFVFSGEIEL
jgi:diaminopimelate epimerase